MKIASRHLALSSLVLTLLSAASAQTVFVNLVNGTNVSTTTATINAPAGYAYSAAAPVAGTTWNVIGRQTTVPQNTVVGSTVSLYTDVALVDSLGEATNAKLSISYYSAVTSGTRTELSTGNGENTIQLNGVMANAWRNYYNAGGNYVTFSFTGLVANGSYDLYIYGGTNGSGQGAGVSQGDGTAFSDPLLTTNTVTNSNDVYGSLFTGSSGSYSLMAQGTTWDKVSISANSAGEFSFRFNGPGSAAYLNGFQLVAIPEPSSFAALMGAAGLGWVASRRRRR